MSTKHRRGALRARKAELIHRFGPDRSPIVHRYHDGWTIRRIESLRDQLREGEMLRHCLRQISDPLPTCFSLRDGDGLPHLTFSAWRFETQAEPEFPSLPAWCRPQLNELGLLWGRWAVMRAEGVKRGAVPSQHVPRLLEFAETERDDLDAFPGRDEPLRRFALLWDSAVPPSTPASVELDWLRETCLERLKKAA